MSVHLKPKNGKEITLDDLRELVEKSKNLAGKNPVLVKVNNRSTKISDLEIDIAE
ncbi:hypothetical protein ACIRJR_09715 [Streptomyces sp. NPDC102402]|uniref:hypothetical protein n=1 Tax=Streptomyces sp. NPDC102402 TaxID=3366169 RepID=UPI0038061B50